MDDTALAKYCERTTPADGITVIFEAGTTLVMWPCHIAEIISSEQQHIHAKAEYMPAHLINYPPHILVQAILRAIDTLHAYRVRFFIPYNNCTQLPYGDCMLPNEIISPKLFVDNGYTTRPAVIAAAARYGWDKYDVTRFGQIEQFRSDEGNPNIVAIVVDGRCYRRLPDNHFAEWNDESPKSAAKCK